MQFISGANTITIHEPQYGYEVELNLALHIERYGQDVGAWDNGGTYDYRVLKMELLTPHTEAKDIEDFFNDTNARTDPFTLRLAANSGFYPAGPDKGCSGDFEVSLYNKKQGGMKLAPFKWFDSSLNLVITGDLMSHIPEQIKEGPFKFGPVSGLRYPTLAPEYEQATARAMTVSGNVGVVNLGVAADENVVDILQSCNLSNAAHLMDFLRGSQGRGSKIEIVAPENYYIFGTTKGSSGTYQTKLLSNKIKVVHDDYNQFSISAKLWRAEN
jgi:hypothetical protein